MTDFVLYQFPLSHYCEKVRWAMDHKKQAYRCVNLLPGLHMKTVSRIATKTSVPVLEHGDQVIQGSARIITYLDDIIPQNPLTPADPDLSQQACDWENFADQEVGVHVRRLCYHYMLDHQPSRIIKYFTSGGPWYGPVLMRVIFPRLKVKMRQFMKINQTSAELSRKRLTTAMEKLQALVSDKSYICGDTFSRADLAFAALLAPFARPEEHEMDWSGTFPEELENIVTALDGGLAWSRLMYTKHRLTRLIP